MPIHAGKVTSSLLYSHIRGDESFASRGEADFASDAVGAVFSVGINNQWAFAVKGAALIGPQEEAQGARWEGRAGYLYGLDVYNEVFPATGYRPGVQFSAGMTGFQVPLDRLISGGAVTLIDQKMSGVDYHGAVLASLKINRFSPYGGVRVFGRSVDWHDNRPGAGAPANIVGHAHGNASVVVGVPIQLTPEIRFNAEGTFLNGTMLTAGLTMAAF